MTHTTKQQKPHRSKLEISGVYFIIFSLLIMFFGLIGFSTYISYNDRNADELFWVGAFISMLLMQTGIVSFFIGCIVTSNQRNEIVLKDLVELLKADKF